MQFRLAIPEDKFKDDNACALLATCHAFELGYKTVSMVYELAGRKRNKGSSMRQIGIAVNALYKVVKRTDQDKLPVKLNMTLAKFSKLYPEGKYIVIKSKHAMALIDGVYVDTIEPNPKARVKYFYKIS